MTAVLGLALLIAPYALAAAAGIAQARKDRGEPDSVPEDHTPGLWEAPPWCPSPTLR